MQRTKKRKAEGKSKPLLKALQPRRLGDDQHLLPLGMTVEGNAVLSNDAAHVVVVKQMMISLTPIEYALLTLLLHHPGTPVASETLIQAAFPADSPERAIGSKLLARHITNIRPKLWATPLTIHAVNNFGYVLRLCEAPVHLAQKKGKAR
jgi:DNA-binding response OmpR family regulator